MSGFYGKAVVVDHPTSAHGTHFS